MAVNAFEQLLFDFQEAEAKWWVKSHLSFKIWARPRFTMNPGWVPDSSAEIHVGTFHLGTCMVDRVNPEKGQRPQNVSCDIVTHCGLGPDDDKRVEHFIRLATKAGAHLCPEIQVHISPDPDGPLNRWLTLMWRLYPAVDVGAKIAGDPEYRFATHQFLDSPFRDSVKAIELCGLHTNEPKWPFPDGEYRPTPEERMGLGSTPGGTSAVNGNGAERSNNRPPASADDPKILQGHPQSAAEALDPVDLLDGDPAEELKRLDQEIPALDLGSADWATTKFTRRLLGDLPAARFSRRRSGGNAHRTKDESHGLHDGHLFWRKTGNDHSYYYMPLIREHAGHLAKIFPEHNLESLQNLPESPQNLPESPTNPSEST